MIYLRFILRHQLTRHGTSRKREDPGKLELFDCELFFVVALG